MIGTITPRGTPLGPRDPPGCPFATRCPAKTQPDDVDPSEEARSAVTEFRAVLRTRARSERSLVSSVLRRLGLPADALRRVDTRGAVRGVELPSGAREVVGTAVDLAVRGEDRAAAERLREAFGSVCDRGSRRWRGPTATRPRACACLRNREEYADTATVLEERYGD